jgi:hypothetical protein
VQTDRRSKKQSAWERTRYQNLFRYVPSGTIFARFKIAGKQLRKSLETTNLELAKNKLAELERNERAVAEDRRRGKMLFGEALDEYLQARQRDATLKPATKAYDQQQVVTLLKTWPGLQDLDTRRIRKEDCEGWAANPAGTFGETCFVRPTRDFSLLFVGRDAKLREEGTERPVQSHHVRGRD